MKVIDGIAAKKYTDYALFHVNELTESIMDVLRKHLSFICYGRSCSESGYEIYNYKNTLLEFVVRYDLASKDIKVGMIGELLSHLIIKEFFPEYIAASPFFNKEERNIKKGFDIILSKTSDNTIWVTEIKSGGLHKEKDSNDTTIDLLRTAKRDLVRRLNEENKSLWLNAMNDARIAFDRHSDLKDSIVEILSNYGLQSTSSEHNVFLVSNLFAPITDAILPNTIKKQYDSYAKEVKFKKLFILSVQKNTHNRIYEFLKRESKR